MVKGIARNVFHREPDEVPDEQPPLYFAHLVDPKDPAYGQILSSLFALEADLGRDAVDDDVIKMAIRVGRARHKRALEESAHGEPKRDRPLRIMGNGRDSSAGVVYYIRRGAMVKIGTTTRLKERMGALRPDEVLAVEPGSYTLEAELHKKFAHLRVPGEREWFYAGREIQEHVEEVLDAHGAPPADLPTLGSDGAS